MSTATTLSAALLYITLAGRSVPVKAWRGERLNSPIALDTETEAFEDDDPAPCPPPVLGSAYDGTTAYLIRREAFGRFVLEHREAEFVAHNAAFDFWVVERWLKARNEHHAIDALWSLASSGRLHDTALLDRLVNLGRRERAHLANTPRSLAELSAELLDADLPKDHEVRLRFGDHVREGTPRYEQLSRRVVEYAARDAIATLLVYQALRSAALEVHRGHRERLLPNAEDAFGLLSEGVQVRGAIALAAISRVGMALDASKVSALEDKLTSDRDVLAARLAHLGVVRLDRGKWKASNKALAACLRRVAEELRDQEGRRNPRPPPHPERQ